jgi:hypothetical protein
MPRISIVAECINSPSAPLYHQKKGNIKKMLNFQVRDLIQNIIIDPSVLRLLWKVVSEVNYQELLSLPDRELSQVLMQKVSNQVALDPEEAKKLDAYVSSKLLLIRDIADAA